MDRLVLALIVACLVVRFPSAAAAEKVKAAPEVLTPTYNEHWNIPIAALHGATVRVWKDNANKFALSPYSLPDWKKFEHDLKQACGGKIDGSSVETYLEVELDSDTVRKEVVRYLNEKGFAKDLDFASLAAYPFAILRFSTGAAFEDDALSSTVRGRLPLSLQSATASELIGINYDFYGKQSVRIVDTCSNLLRLVRFRDFQIQMFAPHSSIRANTMRIALREIRNHEIIKNLFIDQTLQGSKRLIHKSTGGSAGINLGFASWGKSKSTSSTYPIDDRRRAVTGSLLSGVVDEVSRSVHATYKKELTTASVTPDVLFKTLLELVTKRAENDEVQFRKINDSQWELTSKTSTWLLDQPGVAELIQAKSEADNELKKKTEFKYGEIEGKDEKEAKFKWLQDVQWKTDGPTPIPVSANVLIVDENALSYDDVTTWEELQVTYGDGLVVINVAQIGEGSSESERAFKAGFNLAAQYYRGPPRQMLPMPFRLSPDYSKPRPFVPGIICPNLKASVDQAMVEIGKNAPHVSFANADAYVAALKKFVEQLGCNVYQPPPTTGGFILPPPNMLLWADECFVDSRWYWWMNAHFNEIGARLNGGVACGYKADFPMPEPWPDMIATPEADIWSKSDWAQRPFFRVPGMSLQPVEAQ